jgi:hypothetical protein
LPLSWPPNLICAKLRVARCECTNMLNVNVNVNVHFRCSTTNVTIRLCDALRVSQMKQTIRTFVERWFVTWNVNAIAFAIAMQIMRTEFIVTFANDTRLCFVRLRMRSCERVNYVALRWCVVVTFARAIACVVFTCTRIATIIAIFVNVALHRCRIFDWRVNIVNRKRMRQRWCFRWTRKRTIRVVRVVRFANCVVVNRNVWLQTLRANAFIVSWHVFVFTISFHVAQYTIVSWHSLLIVLHDTQYVLHIVRLSFALINEWCFDIRIRTYRALKILRECCQRFVHMFDTNWIVFDLCDQSRIAQFTHTTCTRCCVALCQNYECFACRVSIMFRNMFSRASHFVFRCVNTICDACVARQRFSRRIWKFDTNSLVRVTLIHVVFASQQRVQRTTHDARRTTNDAWRMTHDNVRCVKHALWRDSPHVARECIVWRVSMLTRVVTRCDAILTHTTCCVV